MFRLRSFLGRMFPVFLLVLLDQLVKRYIAQHMMDMHFKIFGNFLDFMPHLNTSYSWLNSLTDMGIGRTVHILTVLVLFALTCIIYDFIRITYSLKTYEHCLFTLLFAGMVCSFLDKVFWGGSLDFIWLKGFFIFDLKDVYLTGAEILLVIKFFINREFRNFKTIEVLREFKEYLKVRFGMALKKK
jgi:Lipoprotein signal peptidase